VSWATSDWSELKIQRGQPPVQLSLDPPPELGPEECVTPSLEHARIEISLLDRHPAESTTDVFTSATATRSTDGDALRHFRQHPHLITGRMLGRGRRTAVSNALILLPATQQCEYSPFAVADGGIDRAKLLAALAAMSRYKAKTCATWKKKRAEYKFPYPKSWFVSTHRLRNGDLITIAAPRIDDKIHLQDQCCHARGVDKRRRRPRRPRALSQVLWHIQLRTAELRKDPSQPQ